MANRSNEPSGYSKEKMLFLRDMFAEHSDTENGLRMVDIQDKVEREYGIRPDRKTIISDIDVLESYGVEIQRAAGGRKDYRLLKGKDDLNVMEVKILIDLIQSSRFLSPAISKRLIRKLEKLCSIHEQKTLHRKVIVPNRERSENTNILYAMNMIDAFPLFLLEIQVERGVFCMYMKDAIAEYGFDCRIRKLSPKTIDCYTKQLRYFQEYLEQNHAVTYLEQVKKAHIKSFLAMMDSKNRKPQ